MRRWRGTTRPTAKSRQSGYTITEVMIVLAVTTALFAMIAISFQGRQARAEFTQAVRNLEAKLQTIATEASSSTYQTVNCIAAPTTGRPQFLTATNNGSCIFLGKVFLPSTTATESSILTMVGRRQVGNPPVDVTSIDQAQGVVVEDGATGEAVVELLTHSYGLEVLKIVRQDDTNVRVFGVGFMNALSGSARSTPAAGVQLYGLLNVQNFTNNQIEDGNFVALSNGVLICLRGQNGQRAEIQVGGGKSQSQIVTEIDTGNEGGCRVV